MAHFMIFFQVPVDVGEMLVSLCYNENLERLTVTVCEAKNLKMPEGQNTLGKMYFSTDITSIMRCS